MIITILQSSSRKVLRSLALRIWTPMSARTGDDLKKKKKKDLDGLNRNIVDCIDMMAFRTLCIHGLHTWNSIHGQWFIHLAVI